MGPCLQTATTQDNKMFFHHKVNTASLPRGDTWLWNQSRSRKTITDYTGNITLSFYKLNTRTSKQHATIAPNHKMWVSNLTILPQNKEISFVWCERGHQASSFDSLVEFDLSDLDFLTPLILGSPLSFTPETNFFDLPVF